MEQRSTNPTEEKMCKVSDLTDNDLRFRNMDVQAVQNVINIFERWCYRRMLRISRTEHVTNEEEFNRANTKPTLLDGQLKRQLAFRGHIARKGSITFDLMIGHIHGTIYRE